jgi:hypothetical protein
MRGRLYTCITAGQPGTFTPTLQPRLTFSNFSTALSYTLNETVVFTISAAQTATLPAAAAAGAAGAYFTVVNAAASTKSLNLASNGGTLPATVLPPGTSITLVSDGANWQPMGAAPPPSVTAQTGSYTLTSTDHTIVFTLAAAAIATLPTAAGNSGRFYTVSNAAASTTALTLASAGGTIPATTVAAGAAARLVSDGTNWQAA